MLRRVTIPIVLLITFAAGAAEGVKRTFVASTGADSNPCSITLPCRSFAVAIAATSNAGEVVVLDSAGYGPVTVTTSVSIVSPAGIYAGISVPSGQDGVTVNAPGGAVNLAGLTVNGQGGNAGINVISAARVRIERCVIANMLGPGIGASPGAPIVEIIDTSSTNNGNSGLFAQGAGVVALNSRFHWNAGDGVNASAGANVVLRDVDASWNSTAGAAATATTGVTRLSVEGGTFSRNGVCGVGSTASGNGVADADVTRTTITKNPVGICSGTVGGTANTVVAASANTISENSGNGLSADGAGAYIMATGNAVSRNGTGAAGSGGAVVFVGGDNSFGFNGTNVGAGVSSYTRQ